MTDRRLLLSSPDVGDDIVMLDNSIKKHGDWKLKFRAAISKSEKMDAETIAKDNCCDLGKWLHGEGRRLYGKLGAFSECLQNHEKFHIEAGKVAILINQQLFSEDEERMGSGSG